MSASSKHTHPYSASDIQKYLAGTLSPEEMHDLEKAALDDPFLQDALDGITQTKASRPGFTFETDMEELKTRLQAAAGGKKKGGILLLSRNFRIAASIIGVVALGGMAWYFLGSQSSRQKNVNYAYENPAKSGAAPAESPAGPPTVSPAGSPAGPSAGPPPANSVASSGNSRMDTAYLANAEPSSHHPASRSVAKSAHGYSNPPVKADRSSLADSFLADQYSVASNVSQPGTEADSLKDILAYAPPAIAEKKLAPANPAERASFKKSNLGVKPSFDTVQYLSHFADNAFLSNNNGYTNSRIIPVSGVVVGANNSPLPGATLYYNEGRRQVSARTDNNGYFSFNVVSPDSLHLHIDSKGYLPANLDVDPMDVSQRTGNMIFLRRRPDSLREVDITRLGSSQNALAKQMESKAIPGETAIQGAIPKGGWPAYRKYLESAKKNLPVDSTLTGAETVSFTVDKKGVLSSFKVEQSLSPAHDSTLIRLIQTGPSWQSLTSHKGRAFVTLTF
jgi:hypothetical protein